MQNKLGIYDHTYTLILKTLEQFNVIGKAYIFGSRAMGNYKKGSDIDLSISGNNITHDIVSRVSEILNEELPIPYFVDVVHL